MGKKMRVFMTKHKKAFAMGLATATIAVQGVIPAFAEGASNTPAFDLATIMTTAVNTMVGDLLKMIAAVLPVTITLMSASIGIAYAVRFIKKIVSKS